jgi:hypothetical protein
MTQQSKHLYEFDSHRIDLGNVGSCGERNLLTRIWQSLGPGWCNRKEKERSRLPALPSHHAQISLAAVAERSPAQRSGAQAAPPIPPSQSGRSFIMHCLAVGHSSKSVMAAPDQRIRVVFGMEATARGADSERNLLTFFRFRRFYLEGVCRT